MRPDDLITTCLHNLLRHKSRTVLTVLGVVVGCCSVVLMISFGIAMNITTKASLAEMGDLSIISVSTNGKTKITNKNVEKMKQIDGALAVTPQLSTSDDINITIQTEDGRYVSEYVSLMGIDSSCINDFEYNTDEGELIGPNDKNSVVFGSYTAYWFKDTMRPEGSNTIDYWSSDNPDEVPDPYFDPMTTKFKLILSSADASADDKKMIVDLSVKGVFTEDDSKSETLFDCIMDIKQMQALINEYRNTYNISSPGENGYDKVVVKVSDLSLVSSVEKEIKAMGFITSSMDKIRKPIEKSARQKQLMFAGLGVISLFVAALGIMNTMIMSITERTREIGVMKALGCFIKNIREIFLLEAGFIGFIGGVIGGLLSLVISCIINLVSLNEQLADGFDWEIVKNILFESAERVSVVPWQLVLGSIAFSVFVGVASGFYPANRAATKISAIEAIKAE